MMRGETREACIGGAGETELGTLLLASLAAATFAAVRLESVWHGGWVLAQTAVSVAGAAGLWLVLQHDAAVRLRLTAWLGVAVAGWLLLPAGGEVVFRALGVGDAPELVLLACLQNAALMLAAFSHHRRCQQTAVLLASFLVLFALVIGSRRGGWVLAGVYGVLVLWWLMARYWDKVSQARAAASVQRCLPVRSSVLAGTVLVVLIAGAAVGGVGSTTYVLHGFLPTSGGDRWHDPYARAGAGDGDALVAGKEDAMSFGPVESELFLESNMPTLYDMFNEQYGVPPKLQAKRERSIALDPGNVKHAHQRIAKSQRSGREFSTLRARGELKRRPLADRAAPAMLYAVGPVPLHLALEYFDRFDGAAWQQTSATAAPQPQLRVETQGGTPWINVRAGCGWPVLGEVERHAVKFINLQSRRVPAPPLLSAVHIDTLAQADFFGWTEDGALEMTDRDQIPQFTVIHLRSSGMNLQALREQDFTAGPAHVARSLRDRQRASEGLAHVDWSLRDQVRVSERLAHVAPGEDAYLQLPERVQRTAQTAREWTRGIPRGWRQVEAVVGRLRTEYQLDRDARAPEDCVDSCGWFLQAGRGPDYLFATTAAVMLRSLGYPMRLVTGFYARPERFDRRAGQTAVLAEDVHVWAEVCIDDRTWIPIEPTPGYAAPRESLTWGQWAAAAARGAGDWAVRHAAGLAILLAVIGFGWFRRVAVFDVLGYTAWRLAARGPVERRVRWTLRLLEFRSWFCGQQRPREATLSNWYGRVAASLTPETAEALQGFLRAAERTLYAPAAWRGTSVAGVESSCRHVARDVTGRRMSS